MKIIQTNLSLNWTNEIMDHQSLTYEVEDNWESFVEAVKSGVGIKVKNQSMPGRIFGREREILEINYDDFHMSVLFNNYTKSLFYAVDVIH